MHMSSYLLPFLDTGIDDICIYLSTLTDIPYLDGEKLSMKTFFLVVYPLFQTKIQGYFEILGKIAIGLRHSTKFQYSVSSADR